MRLNAAQQISQNPSLRWGSSFIFVAGVYACLMLVVLNRPPATQIILAPLTSAVMINLSPMETTSETTREQEPVRKQLPPEPANKPLSALPRIKTADAVLASHTKPHIKKNTPTKRKKIVLKRNIPENIEAALEDVLPAETKTAPPGKKSESASQPQASTIWQSNLLTHIQRYKRYPQQARRRGQEAVIYVRVTMTRNGQVIKHQIEKASRYKTLNREVLTLITRAQPLPPPPKEVSGKTIEILLPVVFSLRR